MFAKSMIALVAFLVVAGTASAMDLQPSWAPEPLPLVPGQVYRTGSPLSRPGIGGLFGSLADSFTMGAVGSSTGIRTNGGGAVLFTGAGFVPVDPSLVPDDAGCKGIEINGECIPALTMAEAGALQDEIDWSAVENADRVAVPGVGERNAHYSFAAAVDAYNAGNAVMDWETGQPVDHANVGACDPGQRLTVAYIEDETLGARAVYVCEVTK